MQMSLICPTAEEEAAYGAALIAMIGVRLYSDFEALIQILPQPEMSIEPTIQPLYQNRFNRYQASYFTLKESST